MSLVAIATSTLTAATSSPSPSSSPLHMLYYHGASSPGQDPGGDGNGECKLLGPFSILVQSALGVLALSSLVYKRWRERPQRPIKVWAFDVSKQVFGSVLLHMANLLMSMFSAGQLEIKTTYRPNPCSFYLLNLGIDTTLGIPILIIVLRILNFAASYTILANPPESIESGNYGQPPRATWWLKQSIIYFMGLFSMKICVFFLIQLLPFIIKIGDWALRWTEGNTALQIAFVMLLFPLIMNAIQYYIIDGFIKKPLSYDIYTSDGTDDNPDDIHRREALLAGLDDAYSSTDSGDEESAPRKDTPSHPKYVANAIHGSEGLLTEDHSPVPPYEPPSSGSSRSEQGGK
ncbi:hypothetical protein N7448_009583 [Penicillium atrosanguineum]|uniref:transcriptional regulator family: Fungal Specific TF n=1 Tax=Penicillium atrosanguineum TaxID=1132637 RepID=UPI0023A55227|nr:transcriptional regulator family: Fungal Specific TF [Penicillium atrosanguineum]KAJ5123486.1 hypothetical protein N7448_009583 [Penicillium atrosanguineum]KAJ5298711.1 transcriptional regulator family: Fungal Specific TF [Penicillium atrosanguineum]